MRCDVACGLTLYFLTSKLLSPGEPVVLIVQHQWLPGDLRPKRQEHGHKQPYSEDGLTRAISHCDCRRGRAAGGLG